MRLVVLLLGRFSNSIFLMIFMVLRGPINGVVCMQIAAFVDICFRGFFFCGRFLH
jgi:hypothetical protein